MVLESQGSRDASQETDHQPRKATRFVFGYVLESTPVVEDGDKGRRNFDAGDALLEALRWPHNGINQTGSPVRILAVHAGVEGIANATPISR